jgi:hypothetical protein
MQAIGQFSLKNQGGFLVKLQFVYIDSSGQQVHADGTGGFPLGKSEVADPGDFGVPNGSMVALYAFVIWGSDNQAKQWFQYEKGLPTTASYTISGTTLDNELGLNSVG